MPHLGLLSLLNIVNKHELGKHNGSYSLFRKCRVLFHIVNTIIKYGDDFDSCTNYDYIKSQMRQMLQRNTGI